MTAALFLLAFQGVGAAPLPPAVELPTLAPAGGATPWVFDLEFDGANVRRASVDSTGPGASGGTGVDRVGIGLRLRRGLDADRDVGLDLSWERSTWSSGLTLGGVKDPLDTGEQLRLDLSWTDRSRERADWFVAGRVVGAADAGRDVLDEPLFGGALGVALHCGETLDLGLTLDLAERHNDDLRIVPLPTVAWDLGDDWFLGREETGLGLTWRRDHLTRFYLAADWDERGYLLGDAPAGASLRDEEVGLRLGMVWRAWAGVALDVYAGVVDRRATLRDEAGAIGQARLESAPTLGFRLLIEDPWP